MTKRYLLFYTILFFSCSNEKNSFNALTSRKDLSTHSVENYEKIDCSKNTIIRPKVDLLFLIDNSGSANFLNKEVIKGLNSLLQHVSERFDYRITLLPLLGSNDDYYVISYNSVGILNTEKVLGSDKTQKILEFNYPLGSGTAEGGISRVVNFVDRNTFNRTGLFRKGAYLLITAISNEDDDTPGPASSLRIAYLNDNYQKLKNTISINRLENAQIRFLSIVPHENNCSLYYKEGRNYVYFSKLFYDDLPLEMKSISLAQDSFDMCNNNVGNIFRNVNSFISDIVINHEYDHWPVSYFSGEINASSISVLKDNGQKLIQSDTNGFKYIGHKTNFPIRSFPNTGSREPVTAHIIKLNGNARVKYPECLVTSVEENPIYYGSIAIDRRPIVNSIKVFVNGTELNKSNSNGWEYIGHVFNQNTKVLARGDSRVDPDAADPFFKTGYILKLYGDAIYKNGDIVNIEYLPEPIN